MDQMATERVCYVHCNFCTTILAVSVPCSSMLGIVTVRCGHCATLLSVNMGGFAPAPASSSPCHQPPPPPSSPDTFLHQLQRQHYNNHNQSLKSSNHIANCGVSLSSSPSSSPSSSSNSSPPSSSSYNKLTAAAAHLECSVDHEPPRTPPIRPPEKRQRVPSAYNKFIKEEIQRIKATNPEISHREAFSLAAKNWAHFPRLHFGLNLEGQTVPAEGTL